MPDQRRYVEVDVFGRAPLTGNPVAVVIDGSGLDDEAMQAFASWTNLSETTFLLPPEDPAADYRVRIFTPGGELPFAGHPTLGSAHAWLESGGTPARDGVVVQECGIGLVELRRDEHGLAFEAPGFLKSGDADEADLVKASVALGIWQDAIVSSQWVDNGPGWLAVEVASVDELLALKPRLSEFGDQKLGAFAFYGEDDPEGRLIEVRAFVPGMGVPEDPVTGSLNAGLARWLIESGRVPGSYLAGQGHAIGRDGLICIALATEEQGADRIWVGGQTSTLVEGALSL